MNTKNNKLCQLNSCCCKSKSINNELTKPWNICDFLKSQPIPEWIKLLKENDKKNVRDDLPKVENPNDVNSICQKQVKAANIESQNTQKPSANNNFTCKNFQKSTVEDMKTPEKTSKTCKDDSVGHGCPCKGMEKSHDLKYGNQNNKPLDNKHVNKDISNNKSKEVNIPKSPCKTDQKPDNVPKCMCHQKIAANNITPSKNVKPAGCSLAVCKTSPSNNSQPQKCKTIKSDNELIIWGMENPNN